MGVINTELFLTLRDEASTALGGITDKLGGLGALAGAAGVGAVVAGIGAIGATAWGAASEANAAVGSMQAKLGLAKEDAEALGDVAVDVFANNFAGSITEAGDAVGIVQQQLGGLVDGSELQGITEDAFRLKDAFGIEVADSVSAAKTLMQNFGLTSKEAYDFIASGQQQGLDRSGDFLDTINEYSTQFGEAGASADQMFSMLQTGLQGGALGTDKAADLMKEFRLRILDGSDATKEMLNSIGLNGAQMQSQLASGQLSVADAFTMVQGGLAGTKDESLQMAAGFQLMGTQFEDLGMAGVSAISLTATSMDDLKGSTSGLDAQYTSLGGVFEGFKRIAITSLIPVGDKMLELANQAMPYVKAAFEQLSVIVPPIIAAIASGISTASSVITPILQAIGANMGGMSGAFQQAQAVIMPVVATIQSVVQAVFGAVAAFLIANQDEIKSFITTTWTTIQSIVSGLVELIQATIIPIFEGIANFIVQNQDTIGAVIKGVWTVISGVITTILGVIQGVIQTVLAVIRGDWDGAWQGIKNIASSVWDGIKTVVSGAAQALKAAVELAMNGLKTALSGIWEGIKTSISGLAQGAKDAAIEKFNALKTDAITAVSAVATGIAGLAGTFASNAATLGQNIVDGIYNAIVNGRQSIINYIIGIARDAVDAIKDFFGIGGSSMGMSGMTPAPASAGMTGGGHSAFGTASYSSGIGAGGTTIQQVNITIGGTNVSAETIKRMVAEGISQAMSDRAHNVDQRIRGTGRR